MASSPWQRTWWARGSGAHLFKVGGQVDAVDEAEEQEEGDDQKDIRVVGHQECQAGQDCGDEHHGTDSHTWSRQNQVKGPL